MDTRLISSIRILPSSKTTFKTETDFRFFIENTMINRGGYYYFPNAMMNCPNNTLVLFQYSAKIRAIGLLIERDKKKRINEQGEEHAGYYRFDINSLKYLDAPIDKDMMKAVCPDFSGFNQTKQIIALEYLNPMTNKNTPESTDRVVQGPDRVYRWKYTLSREQALVHYKFMNNRSNCRHCSQRDHDFLFCLRGRRSDQPRHPSAVHPLNLRDDPRYAGPHRISRAGQ